MFYSLEGVGGKPCALAIGQGAVGPATTIFRGEYLGAGGKCVLDWCDICRGYASLGGLCDDDGLG